MILTAGPADAISFTDDTSLPHAGATVSIHAQVIREFVRDWYYTLLQRAPNHGGELKSSVIVDVFFALPDYERRKVLVTLKLVRIHITDPRPYTYDVDEYLAEIVQDRNVPGFLERLDAGQRQAAKKERGRLIAREMWHDAPSYQLRLKHLVYEYRAGLRIDLDPRQVMVDEGLSSPSPEKRTTLFDVTRFERPRKDVVNVLAPYLSKSESVFCEAAANMDALLESGAISPWLVAADVTKLLARAHAFDAGQPDQVAWVRQERHGVIDWLDPRGMFPVTVGALSEPDSKSSFFVQAADFAAGIARELWHLHSLPHLVDTFDYVTYNGRRICESEAVTIAADLAKRGNVTIQQRSS